MPSIRKIFSLPFFLSLVFFLVACSQVSEDTEYTLVTSGGVQTGVIASPENTTDDEAGKAYVTHLVGEVQKKDSLGSVVVLKEGNLIQDGDTVSTTKNGSLSIVFRDHSILRMGESSTIVVKSVIGKSQNIELSQGKIWARILRPFTDSSFFLVKTSDVSAGVRGSSVYLEKTETGSDVMMFDSGEGEKTHQNVLLTYTSSGTADIGELISPGDDVIIEKTGKKLKGKINMQTIYQKKPFIHASTMQDIVYMYMMLDRHFVTGMTGDVIPLDTPEVTKIRREIGESLPQGGTDEMNTFFTEKRVLDAVDKNTDTKTLILRVEQEMTMKYLRMVHEEEIKNMPESEKSEAEMRLSKMLDHVMEPGNEKQIQKFIESTTQVDMNLMNSSGSSNPPKIEQKEEKTFYKEMSDQVIPVVEIKSESISATNSATKTPSSSTKSSTAKSTTPTTPTVQKQTVVVKKSTVSGERRSVSGER